MDTYGNIVVRFIYHPFWLPPPSADLKWFKDSIIEIYNMFLLPSPRLLHSRQHGLNSMWTAAFLAPYNSKLQHRHRARSQLRPSVYGQMECELWVKQNGEVIMRHPPSVCCLFGQTGCLTAQAVEGILMHMSNDSLSISPKSYLPFLSYYSLSFYLFLSHE